MTRSLKPLQFEGIKGQRAVAGYIGHNSQRSPECLQCMQELLKQASSKYSRAY